MYLAGVSDLRYLITFGDQNPLNSASDKIWSNSPSKLMQVYITEGEVNFDLKFPLKKYF